MSDRETAEDMMFAQDALARAIESGVDPVDALAEYDELRRASSVTWPQSRPMRATPDTPMQVEGYAGPPA